MTISITHFPTNKAFMQALKDHGIGEKGLLTVGTNAKTVKGDKKGYTTAILYMQPSLKLCPMSDSAGCAASCLVSAGRGRFSSVKTARHNKAELYNNDRGLFFSALFHQIKALKKKYKDSLVIRLNGTSDIGYHIEPITVDGVQHESIIHYFNDVQFYDYTKVYTRARHNLPANYDLTLSYSEASQAYADKVISASIITGVRVAVVFNGVLPETYKGFKVIDGDETDLRFLDSDNVIVGLKAKGDAKKDDTGFVIHTSAPKNPPKKSFKNPPAFKGRYYSPDYMRIL